MPVSIESIRVGEYFITPTNQLRLVFKIDKDKKDRSCVHYYAKSAKYIGTPFELIHHPSRPPLLTTFARDCFRRLTAEDIAKLRVKKIIAPG